MPIWYWAFAISLKQKTELLNADKIGSLKHTNFYKNLGMTRGLIISLCLQPVYPFVFGVKSYGDKLLQDLGVGNNIYTNVTTSFIGGCLTAPIANPIESFIIRLQNNNYNYRQTLLELHRNHGLTKLWRGTHIMIPRNGVFGACLFGLQPYFNHTLFQSNNILSSFCSSIIPAIIACSASMVFDLGAVKLQSDPTKKYLHFRDVVKKIYIKHGLLGFCAGIKMRILATCIEMTCFNMFIDMFNKM